MPLRHCIACLNTRGFGILILQKRYQKKRIYTVSHLILYLSQEKALNISLKQKKKLHELV